jgi:uncharacterized coiled-coil protein SlyX
MPTEKSNPFVLPGFGQSGDAAQNPLMASMEMMRQAWQGLAGTGVLEHSSLAVPMTIEDLDRRITDLRAVENWLRMNLSMLNSTIQALEVQRATISTLKSFIRASGTAATSGSPSPLEAVLGIKPGAPGWPGTSTPPPSSAATADPDTATDVGANKAGAAPASGKQAEGTDQASGEQALDTAAALNNAVAATQGWWDMLQKQFDTLANATAATIQGAEGMKIPGITPPDDRAASDSTLGKKGQATKSARGAARSAASAEPQAKDKRTRKSAGAQTPAAAKKAAKTPARKTAASGSRSAKKT